MKAIDDRLDLISGIGYISKGNNEASVKHNGGLARPSVSNLLGDGPNRGPLKRPVLQKDQNRGGLQSKTS